MHRISRGSACLAHVRASSAIAILRRNSHCSCAETARFLLLHHHHHLFCNCRYTTPFAKLYCGSLPTCIHTPTNTKAEEGISKPPSHVDLLVSSRSNTPGGWWCAFSSICYLTGKTLGQSTPTFSGRRLFFVEVGERKRLHDHHGFGIEPL